MRLTGVLILPAAAIAIIATWQVPAQSLRATPVRDDTFWAWKDDADMVAAMRKARATLPDFLALARAPRTSTSHFTVKVRIRDGDDVEYFWIIPFVQENGRFSGKVDNEPDLVKNVKYGDVISFAEDEIVDWSYLEDGMMRGNYTLCAASKRGGEAAMKALFKQYGLTCDF